MLSEDSDEPYGEIRKITYDGEDTSPTSSRELTGWYAYPIAAEVFAVVAVGAFLPVVLEQLARENGTFFSDPTKPCVHIAGSDATSQAANITQTRSNDNGNSEQCMVQFFGKIMSTSSFAMYTFSTAVLVQAVVLVCFSSFADHGPHRKNMLIAFAYLGSAASALWIFITPKLWFLGPILVVLGVTSLGCSFVLLNAFLPLLVSNHPEHVIKDGLSNSSLDFELDSFHERSSTSALGHAVHDGLTLDLERSSQISSRGVGYGYASAVLVQVLSILVLWLFSKTEIQKRNPSLSIRVILMIVGLWWAVFTVPTLLWLKPRPGRPLPALREQTRPGRLTALHTVWIYCAFSLRSFWRTVRTAFRLRQTVLFLTSWFLLSDAVATISGTAVLFARTELHMGTIPIALLSITSIGCGIIGAFAWPRVQAHWSLEPKTILLFCIVGLEAIPIYGLLGYLPVFKRLGFIGLQQAWEIYPIAVLHGTIMGGISSYARSVYAPLIPEGREAAFFALYAVTDKGSSAVGPALVGWIIDQTGTIRPAFFFLAVLVVLPAPLLWQLNITKGREDARAVAGEEDITSVTAANTQQAVYQRISSHD